jgi:tetratricopeptide (TPR) repeat protein
VRDLTTSIPDFDHAPSFSLADRSERASRGRGVGDGGGGGGLFGAGGGRGEETRGGQLTVAAKAKAEADERASQDASIAIKPWTPDTPYLKALQSAPADQAYAVYLKQRASYESSPGFYLDCADFFSATNKPLALRILTNIPELGLDDARLLRIAAHRLQQLQQLDLAIDLFEKVARLQPEEPQSHRDLALALADRAEREIMFDYARRRLEPDHTISDPVNDFQRAINLLHKVVMNHWDRFDEIEVIALTEANHILARVNSLALNEPRFKTVSNPFDPRLVKILDPDLRIVMTWDTDNTDIDLHVTEPTGETCVYNHNRTTIGGALSRDFTQGYGPEEYLLKRLMPGQYKIQAHFFGNRDQRAVGPTTVQATVITHFGRPDEKRQSLTLRLKEAKDMVDIGTVTLK